jgi:threonine/homoserine/homoserine lactone efflux protein
MIDPVAFTLASFALLATPGPTNTLLATSGASAGFRRSAHLVVAEMLGYLISITTLSLVIGPLVRASHTFDIVLRVLCALFLFYAAWKLWREGAAAISSEAPVSFRRVFVATLLNPKGVVFAFVIVPYLSHGAPMAAVPYMAGLLGLICLVGGAWIAGGAALRAGASGALGAGLARRAGALVLCVFAAIISGSALSA